MKAYLDRTRVPVDGMLFEASVAAMQGILANRTTCNSPDHVARQAVSCAKALIKELTEREGERT